VNFLQFLSTTIWNDVYQHDKAKKVSLDFYKKLTKNKVISNHGDLGGDQNRVLDMTNFKTNFLSNHN